MKGIIINQFVFVLACLTFFVIGLVLFATASEAKINTENMVAAWLFDDGKGKDVKDSSTNGNDGKITGNPKWVAGKFGRALEFDGSTYVEVADNSSLGIVDEITIVAMVNWIQFKDAGILSKSQDGGGDGNYFLSTGCGGGPTQAKQGSGVILNISSDLGIVGPDQRLYEIEGRPPEEQPVKPVTYSVVKTGIVGLTRYLATYWARCGVRVNALCPGGVEAGQSEEFKERVHSRIPMNRMARKDEYHGTVLFMISDESSYVNGAVLAVDGGRTCW